MVRTYYYGRKIYAAEHAHEKFSLFMSRRRALMLTSINKPCRVDARARYHIIRQLQHIIRCRFLWFTSHERTKSNDSGRENEKQHSAAAPQPNFSYIQRRQRLAGIVSRKFRRSARKFSADHAFSKRPL